VKVFIFLIMALFFQQASARDPVAKSEFRKYEFELGNDKKKALENAVLKLRLGESLSAVKGLLGSPDAESPIYKPNLLGPNTFVFTRLDYYIKRVHLNIENTSDVKITLYFDKSGKLLSIDAPTSLTNPKKK